MTRTLTILAAAGLATAAVAWQRSVDQLQQNGKTISTNLRVVDGTLMVPVKDVASYLGGDLKVQNGTATISSTAQSSTGTPPFQSGAALPGFSYQNGALSQTGLPTFTETKRPMPKELVVKPGQDAISGGFALRLVSIEDMPKGSYRTQFDGRRRKVSPLNGDERLVVAQLRIENVGDATRRPSVPSGTDLVLFDGQGVGTPVLAFDARSIGAVDESNGSDLPSFVAFDAPLLTPKGAFEFAALFSVPKGRTLKRLTVALPSGSEGDAGANVVVGLEP